VRLGCFHRGTEEFPLHERRAGPHPFVLDRLDGVVPMGHQEVQLVIADVLVVGVEVVEDLALVLLHLAAPDEQVEGGCIIRFEAAVKDLVAVLCLLRVYLLPRRFSPLIAAQTHLIAGLQIHEVAVFVLSELSSVVGH
jgi:hypothetical protein